MLKKISLKILIKNYIKAARLRTLPLSLSGVILGALLALSEEKFEGIIFLWSIIATLGFQIVSNFANDYGDGVKGTDNLNRIGPSRTIQTGLLTPKQLLNALKIAVTLSVISAITLIYLSFGSKNFVATLIFIVLALASIWAAIKYTMGKNPYGYSGFGDIFVFLFFGLLGVFGSYFLYTKALNFEVLLPACSVGLLSASVLNLNNMRDYKSDKLSNKRTLVVQIGPKKAKHYHYLLLFLSGVAAVVYAFINGKTNASFLFLIAYIPISIHFYTVLKNNNPEKLDPELKKMSIYTLFFSLLFGLGFVAF
jgi:1,4-dihydroxy-2-naphthoate octaprenyltransferase